MIIEWLTFQVTPELREQFVQLDDAIWTPSLKSRSGFLSKEVWIDADDPTGVAFVIRWATREQWQAIPADELAAIEQEFAQAMGTEHYQLVNSQAFQVRKLLPNPA